MLFVIFWCNAFYLNRRPVYGVLVGCASVVFLVAITKGVLFFVAYGVIFLLPIVISLAFSKQKSLPFVCSHWIALLLSGFLLTWMKIAFAPDVHSELSQDLIFLCSFLLSIGIYQMLAARLVSVVMVIELIILFGLELSLFVAIESVQRGGFHTLASARLGLGTTINPNLLASVLDLIVPLSCFLAISTGGDRKIYYGVVTIGMLLIQILTGSRGSVPSIILLGAVVVYAMRKRIGFLIAIALGICVVASFVAPMAIERMLHPSKAVLVSNWDRFMLVNTAKNVLSKNGIVFGTGFNVFHTIKYSYGFPKWVDPAGGFSSHNAHLEILLGWGAFSFIGWIGLLMELMLRNGLIAWRSGKVCIHSFIVVTVGSFFVHGIVDSVLSQIAFVWLLAIVIGVAMFCVLPNADLDFEPS